MLGVGVDQHLVGGVQVHASVQTQHWSSVVDVDEVGMRDCPWLTTQRAVSGAVSAAAPSTTLSLLLSS